MFHLLILLIVLILIVALALYVIDKLVADAMLNKILRVVVIAIACLAAISLLLDLSGAGWSEWPRLR